MGPILTSKLKGSLKRDSQIKVGNWALLVPLGNPLPNTIWHLEKVLREYSEIVKIPWDFDEHGNTCKVGKW